MTHADLRAAIEAALGAVAYDPPITPAYCTAVRDALRAHLPNAVLDVYHRTSDLIVEARVDSVCERMALPLV